VNVDRIFVGAVLGAAVGAVLMQGRGARSLRRRRRRALSRGAPFDPVIDMPAPVQWAILGGVVAGLTG
jgi:hypothetical protein